MNELFSLKKSVSEQLEKFGSKYKNLVILDSDLKNKLGTFNFAKLYPDRHFCIPLEENTMISMAAGMTIRTNLPMCFGEAYLLITKGFEALRNSVALPNLNIKIIASSSGISNIEEGPAHICLEDIAIMRTLPNFQIICPADHYETKAALEYAINTYGPVYIRLPDSPIDNIYDQNYQFEIGKPQIIKNGNQVTILSYGLMLHYNLAAAHQLEKRGVSVQVINIPSIIPLNQKWLHEHIDPTHPIFIIEDHHQNGGLGSIIMELFANQPSRKIIKITPQNLNESGKLNEILKRQGLDSNGIYEKIKKFYLSN